MQEIFVNSKKFGLTFKDSPIHKIVHDLKHSLEGQNKIVTEIMVDGRLYAEIDKNNTSEAKRLDFTVIEKSNYGVELIEISQKLIDQTITLSLSAASSKSWERLSLVMDGLDMFIQTVMSFHQVIDFKLPKNAKLLSEIKSLEIHLLSVIKALNFSSQKSDPVMLCDLLEHELTDNLRQWKIKISSELKTIIMKANSL